MDGTRDRYVKWNKPILQIQESHVFCMWNLGGIKDMKVKGGLLGRGKGEGEGVRGWIWSKYIICKVWKCHNETLYFVQLIY
jgi:hypothetical protein